MKWFVRSIMLIAIIALLATCAAGANRAPVDTRLKVLFEVGGPVHDNAELYPIMKKALEDTGRYVVTVSDDRDRFTAPRIKEYDAVLIYTTSGALTEDQEKGLVGFVEGGKGLVGIHSATDSFKNSDAYWKLLGGRFIGHGGGKFKVKITGKSHAIVQGLKDFEISDETYRHKFHPDSKLVVLMRREEDGEPASWVQYVGKGRVFVTGLGHGKEAWENPAFQEMMVRAMDWSTKKLNP